MNDSFICHSEADEIIALEVALAFEEAGYSTWYYERDNAPGESYLIQVGRAIEESRSFVFIASQNSIISNQVISEVVRAYETRVPCVPLLVDITHRELGHQQPALRQALVTSTSIEIPQAGIAAIMPRVRRGLENLGIKGQGRVPAKLISETHRYLDAARSKRGELARPSSRSAHASRKLASWIKPVTVAALGLLAVVVVWALLNPRVSPPRETTGTLPGDSVSRTSGESRFEARGVSKESLMLVEPAKTKVDSSGTKALASRRSTGSPAAEGAKSPEMNERIATIATETDRRTLLVLMDDASAIARNRFLQSMATRGISIVDPAQTEAIRSAEESVRALEGSDPSCRRLGVRAHAAFVLIGKVVTMSVPNDFGMKSVRAEISLRLVSTETGRRIAGWTQGKTVAHLSHEIAERTALEGIAEAMVDSVAQRIPKL